MGEPDAATLIVDFVDDELRRHLRGIHVLVYVEAHEVMHLPTERIARVELGPLDEDEVIRTREPVDVGNVVVIGDAQKA